MHTALDAYGRLAARRPRRLLLGWLAAVVLLVAGWGAVGTQTDDAIEIPRQ